MALIVCFSLEPERALEIYEQAIKKNPRDSQLAAKMGQVNLKEIFISIFF